MAKIWAFALLVIKLLHLGKVHEDLVLQILGVVGQAPLHVLADLHHLHLTEGCFVQCQVDLVGFVVPPVT